MIRTGIGGWVYPDWRKGNFYPEGLAQKRELEYASRALGAIEINGTYHSLQKPESFRKWREATPEGFKFAIKGSSYISNRKVLASAGESMVKFFGQGLEELGDRLGPIVWQMMHTKKFDAEDVAAFFALLPRELKGLPPEILVVPLPGHTAGHAGIAVLQGEKWLLHAGDAYFYRDEMDPRGYRCTPGLRFYQWFMETDRRLRLENQRRLRDLVRDHGQAVRVFCAHDAVEFEQLSRTQAAIAPPPWAEAPAGMPRPSGV